MELLIIDNDLQFLKMLSNKLKQTYKDVLIDTFTYVPNDNELKKEYTVIFIDILIGQSNGIEAAKRLKNIFPKAHIVFMSNFQELIFQTQEIRPLCFIRKNEFNYDFMIFMQLLQDEMNSSIKLSFELVKSNSMQQKNRTVIQSSDIVYVECFLHKIIINTYNEQYFVKSSMKEFMSMVQNCRYFFRIHRSYVINMNYVYRINKTTVNMINEDVKNELEISRKYKKEFINAFKKLLLL